MVAPVYGNVKDVLLAAPYPHNEYLDIFPPRREIIARLSPPPESVFEFGALLGAFLLTACDAAPSIRRVGWIDNEAHQPGSNAMCAANIADYCATRKREVELFHNTVTRNASEFGQADLVQVDAAHSYPDCLTDLVWALELKPRVIFVDDYIAIDDVRRATDEFARWQGLAVERHETVNGLAVLRL
jgi:hypothetical protein